MVIATSNVNYAAYRQAQRRFGISGLRLHSLMLELRRSKMESGDANGENV